MADIRIRDLPNATGPNPPVASDVIAIDGATTRRTTIQEAVNVGAPVASQAESEAGTDNSKRMTALTTKQSIASEVGDTIASAAQGELADSSLQPDDIGVTIASSSQGEKADTALQPDDVPTADSINSASSRNLSAFALVTVERRLPGSIYCPAKYRQVAQPTNAEPSDPLKFQDANGIWFECAEIERDARMYGLKNSVSDQTAVFLELAAYDGIVKLPPSGLPGLSQSYKISGTIPVHAKIQQSGDRLAEIDLTVDVATRGLWLQSGGSIAAKIKKTVNVAYVGSGAGAFNNAIYIGNDLNLSEDETVDWSIHAEIEAAGIATNGVTLLGNVHRGHISRLHFTGVFTQAFLTHWWWADRYAVGGSKKSHHPRNIVIDDYHCVGNSTATSEVACILSGSHDIHFKKFFAKGCISACVIQAGDIGGEYAAPVSSKLVMSGIELDYIETDNISSDEFRVNGYGFPLEGTPRRWLMVNNAGTGVRVGTMLSRKGPNSGTSSYSVRFRMARNCHVENLIEVLGDGANPALICAGALIEASIDCSVKGATARTQGANIASGCNIAVDLAAKCSMSDYSANTHSGIALSGSAIAATLAAALNAGDQVVQLAAVTTLIHPGMLFENSGRFYEFTEGFYYDPSTPAGVVSLGIKPASVGVASGQTVSLLIGVYDLDIDGDYRSFWAGVRVNSSSPHVPRNVKFRGVAEWCGAYGFYANNGANFDVSDSVFDFNGQLSSATEAANVRFDGACSGLKVTGNIYNQKGGAKVAFNNYFRETVSAIVNVSNRHYNVDDTRTVGGVVAHADFYRSGSNSDRADIANWYHPDILNPVGTLPTSIAIAAGVISVPRSAGRIAIVQIDTEAAAASDDLDTINGGLEGQMIVLMSSANGRPITVKDGTGNLQLSGDFALSHTHDTILLTKRGTVWRQISRSDNA